MKTIDGGKLLDLGDDGDFMAWKYELTSSDRVIFHGEWLQGGAEHPATLDVLTLEEVTDENLFTVGWDEVQVSAVDTIQIYDIDLQQDMECTILATTPAGEANLLMVEYDGLEIAVVRYLDGMYFTNRDWQGPQPKTPDEIGDYRWVDKSGNEAVVLHGLPRMLLA